MAKMARMAKKAARPDKEAKASVEHARRVRATFLLSEKETNKQSQHELMIMQAKDMPC